MKKFLLDIKFVDGSTDVWSYNNFDNEIVSKRFGCLNPRVETQCSPEISFRYDDEIYKYLNQIKWFEVNLGLQCNLDCPICSQRPYRNVIHSASPKDVDPFIEQVKHAIKYGLHPELIKYWGGEPLVHWKTLVLLIPKMRELFPETKMSMASNCTLLTKEIVDFLKQYNVRLNCSCDGVIDTKNKQQNILDDPEKLEVIKYAQKLLGNGFSFMPVISDDCQRLDTTMEYYKEKLGIEDTPPTSIVVLKANDTNKDIIHDFSQEVKDNITDGMYCAMVKDYTKLSHTHLFNRFLNRVAHRENIYSVTPHCENQERGIIVDLAGNVYDCKMRVERNGTLYNLNEIPSKHKVHFLYRKNCPNCPLVQICAGGCVRQKDGWEHDWTCKNSYYPCALGQFKAAFKVLFNVEVTGIRDFNESEIVDEELFDSPTSNTCSGDCQHCKHE